MRIHITDALSGDCLSADIFNSFGLHVLSKGTILNERELSRLYQHQIDYLEIVPRTGIHEDENENENEEIASRPSYNPLLRPLYQDAVAGAVQLFELALAEGKIYEEDVKESFQPLIDNFNTERDVVSLLLMLNSQDDYTYQHSVQVGMLSYYIARWLGWDEEDTILASKAGFLHDIGKCKISEAILNSPNKLSDEEFNEVKNHPIYGYEILKTTFNDSRVSLAALQHHERMDGTGYPNGLKGDEISPMAKIVAIADVYSAMISTRAYSQKRDLLVVLKEMYELSFGSLDPQFTHVFILHMLPNFIGKKLELTNGDMGTIVMTNPVDFFRPLVQTDTQFIDLSVNRQLDIKQIFM
ncbi:MAG: HD-GYP domain-containing protein [Candidatus Cohnella colombiensis]|uniref:HD-GYP domain-containing protein n=1 Tax=Candidatus Cohnella colombiensis TaxID=3121368 RepID=A0AA95EYU9_9BACL|nr:MAG: HD-GYP domain-containing protein [Cohnella sp.]